MLLVSIKKMVRNGAVSAQFLTTVTTSGMVQPIGLHYTSWGEDKDPLGH